MGESELMTVAPARRRMAALATSTALFILVESAFRVIGPLWATRELGLDNDEWAWLRSAGEFGGFASVLALGILAERLGARWMSVVALAGAGLALAALASGAGIFALMAVLGAFSSIIYVSFNTLAQRVSARRQGLANAIYRAAGAAAAIVAPAAATQAAGIAGAYAPVIVASAAVMGLAGLAIVFFSEPEQSPRAPPTIAAALATYRRCFGSRPLIAFIAITRSFGVAVAAVGAFFALRFTQELGLGDLSFGLLCSIVAVGNLVALLASGWIMDRLRPSRALGIAWLGCGAGAFAMGFSDSLAVAIAGYALFAPLQALCSVPLSLWSSRIAAAADGGPGENAVFTVQKLFQSGVMMLVMALLGALEPVAGMGTLMWCGGLLCLPLALAVFRIGDTRKL